MTHEERLLRELANWSGFSPEYLAACEAGANALARERRCCGNCKHAGESDMNAGLVWCAGPSNYYTHPFAHECMPYDERCKGWEAREDA